MEEIDSIKQTLAGFEKDLYGFNYQCHFIFEKICDGVDFHVAREVINKKYKLKLQIEHNLESIDYDKFVKDFSEKLLYRGDKGAGVKMTYEQELDFNLRLIDFKEEIYNTFNPSVCKIYVHPELRTWIFWGFCFLIVSKERNDVYLFEGLSSD